MSIKPIRADVELDGISPLMQKILTYDPIADTTRSEFIELITNEQLVGSVLTDFLMSLVSMKLGKKNLVEANPQAGVTNLDTSVTTIGCITEFWGSCGDPSASPQDRNSFIKAMRTGFEGLKADPNLKPLMIEDSPLTSAVRRGLEGLAGLAVTDDPSGVSFGIGSYATPGSDPTC